MFENMTHDAILYAMLARITSDVDKREGSIIYDALAPSAYQLAQAYFNLNNFLDLVFGDTAVGEYLDRVVANYGITRKAATYAVRKIDTSGPVAVGTRWGMNGTTYKVTELLETDRYSATCEQAGDIGNAYNGTLENIDNVEGITSVLTDIITPGNDIESDDNLRARFYAQIQAPSTSGNADNYKEWSLEVANVGNARIFPLWNGAGTVKVLIVDSDMAIDDTLPASVKAHIETVRPIGAAVTVASPTSLAVSITANVILDGTRVLSDVQSSFAVSLGEYLRELVFENYTVSYAKIGSLLLDTKGVRDYRALLVNSETQNLAVESEQIPVAGTVTLTAEVV